MRNSMFDLGGASRGTRGDEIAIDQNNCLVLVAVEIYWGDMIPIETKLC